MFIFCNRIYDQNKQTKKIYVLAVTESIEGLYTYVQLSIKGGTSGLLNRAARCLVAIAVPTALATP